MSKWLVVLSIILVGSSTAWSAPKSCTTMVMVEPRFLTHQIDGDTIALFSIPQGVMKFRIEGVNTPEKDQPGWAEARALTWAWLQEGPFTLDTCWKRTLDRYVATVKRGDDTLRDVLLRAGMGK